MNTSTWILFAVIASAGVFLAFAALVFPPRVRLEQRGGSPLARLQQRLDAAELSISAREFLVSILMIGAVALVVGTVLRTPVFGIAGMVMGPLLFWQSLESKRDKFRESYAESLAEVVSLLREGFAATGAMRDAFHNAVDNGPDPAAADFREVWTKHELGEPLEDAFGPLLERRRDGYLNMVAEALTLKSSHGGSASEVLAALETMIREQTNLRKEISAKQAQARLESTIVSLAPLGFFLLFKLLPWMRAYEGGFYNTALGQGVLLVVIVFSVIAYVVSRRLATRGLTLEVKEVTTVVMEV